MTREISYVIKIPGLIFTNFVKKNMKYSPFNTDTLNPIYNPTLYIATTIKGAILCGCHFVVIHSKQTRHEKNVDLYEVR